MTYAMDMAAEFPLFVTDRDTTTNTRVQRRVRVELRPLDIADVGYARAKWREAHHQAPGKRRLPWSAYKLTFGEQIDRVLEREDTWMLGAYDHENKLRGFVAWTPGRPATVHYVWVRRSAQRQGLALRLIEAADVGPAFRYTFRGLKPRRGPAMDDILVAALDKRAVRATYQPAASWLGEQR